MEINTEIGRTSPTAVDQDPMKMLIMLNTTPIRYITAQSFYIQPEYIIFLSLSYNCYTRNLARDGILAVR